MCRGDMYPCTQDEFHPINSVSKNSIGFDINDQNTIIGTQLYQFTVKCNLPPFKCSWNHGNTSYHLTSMLHHNQWSQHQMLPQCALFYSLVGICLQTIFLTNHFILEVNFFVIQLELSSIYSRVDTKKKKLVRFTVFDLAYYFCHY